MNVSSHEALELCRGLLAFSAPGMAVAVPHAALAQIVELASGAPLEGQAQDAAAEPLQELFDVAALARRYNRATTTVRQWFHDGLFGPPAERRFRGRGYVAPAEAVHEFEARTGLKSVVVPGSRPIAVMVDTSAETSEAARTPRMSRKQKSPPARAGGMGGKIFAAQGGLRVRRSA
jgi:hypothetical protein